MDLPKFQAAVESIQGCSLAECHYFPQADSFHAIDRDRDISVSYQDGVWHVDYKGCEVSGEDLTATLEEAKRLFPDHVPPELAACRPL